MVRRILIPVDDAPQSWEALDYALKTHPDADFHVLHVTDPMEWIYSDEFGGEYSPEAHEHAKETAERLLDRARATADEHGVGIETVISTGKPARMIVKYADENDIDHIVIGSHGRTGLARVLLGSVAETVVRRSGASVTVVR